MSDTQAKDWGALGRPPRILFIHQNYPGQFGKIGVYLQNQGWDVIFATAHNQAPQGKVMRNSDGLRVFGYKARREVPKANSRYLQPLEKAIVNGQAFASDAQKLKRSGWEPDIICAHSGWGSGSFAKVVWPNARFVQYLEWWYSHPPKDREPGEKFNNEEDRVASTLCRNLPFLLDWQTADAILVPTKFQATDVPDDLRHLVTVMHDGCDAAGFSPGAPEDPSWIPEGVDPNGQIVTYATRGMEPMRGFPQFMAAWAKVQHTHPKAQALIAGTDTVHYADKLPKGDSYKKRALAAHEFDRTRLHFVGRLPMNQYRDLMRLSKAHIYLTRPFVLSWSLVDAMATGCPLIVSDNAPLREALPTSDMATHVDHNDIDALADAIRWTLDHPEAARRKGELARKHALEHYDRKVLFERKEAFYKSLLDKPVKPITVDL
jgi:glycosyltransferase involved in cell wall biosynthesis